MSKHFRGAVLITALLAVSAGASAAPADKMNLIRDQEIEDTLRRFSMPIFDQAGLSPNTVRFILVNDGDLNAFVAGGQNIFLNTGLILETANPEEITGVIAHETGHIAGGHLFRMQQEVEDLTMQAMLANLLGLAGAIASGSGQAGVAVASAGSALSTRMMLRHTRVQETAADQAGVRYLKDSGLPVSGFITFMQKLEAQELLPENQQSQYVRTHPLSRDRVDFLENTAASLKRKGDVPAGWPELHNRMKAKLEGYLFPDRVLLKKNVTDISGRYALAIAQYRKGKTETALKTLDPLIAEEPNNPYFHELKAQMLFESGRINESLAPYEKSVSILPHAAMIRSAYGYALLEAGKLAQAQKEFQRSLGTDPHQPRTHRFLAIAYGKQGEEGLSRLHLAEEAYMTGKIDNARTEAGLARKSLPKNSSGWLRATDMLDAIKRQKERKKD